MNNPPDTISADPVANDWPYWQCRLVARGPWTPARLWRDEERDPETGALVADVVYRAEIDGLQTDPFTPQAWPWTPITEAEWRYLTDRAAYAREWAPADPAANPGRPIDHNDIPSLF